MLAKNVERQLSHQNNQFQDVQKAVTHSVSCHLQETLKQQSIQNGALHEAVSTAHKTLRVDLQNHHAELMRFNHDRQAQWAETMKTDRQDLLHTIQACNAELLEMVHSTTQEMEHSIHTLAESMAERTRNMTSQGVGIARLEHQARFPEGHSRKTESPQSTSQRYPSGPQNKQSESESEYGGKMSQKGQGKNE